MTIRQSRTELEKTELDVEELMKRSRRSAFLKDISPMLATLTDSAFKLEGWFFEPKLDGVRVISYIKDGTCRLSSRRGNDLTDKYPTICQSLMRQKGSFVFDGEVVALDQSGKPSFQFLQQSSGGLRSFAAKSKKDYKVVLVYYVFDILHADGKDLTGLPLIDRKILLAHFLQTNKTVRLVQSLGSDGIAAFQACIQNGLEGIVGKQADSVYESGTRSRAWLKIKTALTGEFLIAGFTEGTGSRRDTFGSLLLGELDRKGKLQFVGGVGTGLNGRTLDALLKRMKPLITKLCPFENKPTGKLHPTWVKPELIAEVKFSERTQDNVLRAPVYLHLREDIEPGNVKQPTAIDVNKDQSNVVLSHGAVSHSAAKSKPSIRGKSPSNALLVLEQLDNNQENLTIKVDDVSLPLTHLNKVFWPEHDDVAAITKRDYLIYLAHVSEFILPHLADRLVTLVRFPNGIDGGRFYQKHWEQGLPKFVKTAAVFTEHENKDQDFLICNNLSTLLWLGQIADLELHTSHTRITVQPDATHLPTKMTGSLKQLDASIANYPDYLVLDLDPYLYSGLERKGAEPELHKQGFSECSQVAIYLKKHLDNLGLASFIKTSGKTGLHIYVPIVRNVDYDTVRTLSQIICQQILKEHPNEVTMDWATVKRKGKVFLDHNMNARSKSLASIYSPRVSPEACVSTPLRWEELGQIYPTDFNMRSLPHRLVETGDLWGNILDCKNDLKKIFGSENLPSKATEKASARRKDSSG